MEVVENYVMWSIIITCSGLMTPSPKQKSYQNRNPPPTQHFLEVFIHPVPKLFNPFFTGGKKQNVNPILKLIIQHNYQQMKSNENKP